MHRDRAALLMVLPRALAARDLAALASAIGLLLLASVASALIPIETGKIVDDLTARNLHLAEVQCALLATSVLVAGLSSVTASYLSAAIGRTFNFRTSKVLLAKVHYLPLATYQTLQVGSLSNRIRDDVTRVGDAIQNVFVPTVTSIMALPLSLGGMFFLDRELSWILAAMMAVWQVCTILLGRKIVRLQNEQKKLDDDYNHVLLERISAPGFLKTRQTASEEASIATISSGLLASLSRSKRIAAAGGLAGALSNATFGLGPAVAFAVGAPRVIQHSLSLGNLMAFIAFSSRVAQPLALMTNVRFQLSSLNLSARRILEMLDLPNEPAGGIPGGSDVSFQSVSIYRDTRVLLEDLNFALPSGAFVRVSGANGSGKSTLMLVLAKLHDDVTGTLSLGGGNLHDLSGFAVRRIVRYIPAASTMFALTLRDNLLLGIEERPNDDEMWRILHLFGLGDAVRRLPNGLDSIPGGLGVELSAGECQALQLCAAVLARPRLLILDEATSALSIDRELEALSQLRRVLPETTLVVVSHRSLTGVPFEVTLTVADGHVSVSSSNDTSFCELLSETRG